MTVIVCSIGLVYHGMSKIVEKFNVEDISISINNPVFDEYAILSRKFKHYQLMPFQVVSYKKNTILDTVDIIQIEEGKENRIMLSKDSLMKYKDIIDENTGILEAEATKINFPVNKNITDAYLSYYQLIQKKVNESSFAGNEEINIRLYNLHLSDPSTRGNILLDPGIISSLLYVKNGNNQIIKIEKIKNSIENFGNASIFIFGRLLSYWFENDKTIIPNEKFLDINSANE
ncbi:hypothetical protein [Pedobacter changchengzhani]|nr:hypothetical protein [Pedobacter changchengzhani]